MDLRVRPDAVLGAVLDWGAGARRCAVGRAGIGEKRREGDGITPVGRFPIRRVLYRADRLERPQTSLAVAMIMPGDGWCDAPSDPRYNKPVTLPCAASAEKMWREDPLYDVVAVLGFNDEPVAAGLGSAIFLHVAREDYAPTEGCVALALPDLLQALAQFAPGNVVEIAL
jgi:L,D-peptidoglycan transpeptidase YkuD (ErfK/YbiS/YcfS/YnhG family)